jgi:hypothetical protein
MSAPFVRVNGMLDFNLAPVQLWEPAQCLPTRDELLASLQLTASQ